MREELGSSSTSVSRASVSSAIDSFALMNSILLGWTGWMSLIATNNLLACRSTLSCERMLVAHMQTHSPLDLEGIKSQVSFWCILIYNMSIWIYPFVLLWASILPVPDSFEPNKYFFFPFFLSAELLSLNGQQMTSAFY